MMIPTLRNSITVAGLFTIFCASQVHAQTPDASTTTKGITKLSTATVHAQTPDASTTTKGITKLSTAPVVSTNPIAVGDNDPRANVYQNINSFGAIGDGTTDNSTALQNAINAGYAVIVPSGTFNFSTTLTLKKDSIIVGTGKKSVLQYTGLGVALREAVGSFTGGYDNLKLMNFTLSTNNHATTGIELTNTYQVTIQGLYVDGTTNGFSTAGIHVIGSNQTTPPGNAAVIRITDGEVWNCTGDGIRISGSTQANGLWIEHNHITSNNGFGIDQTIVPTPYPASNLHVAYNVIEGNVAGGINADSLYASSIVGNYFENAAGSTVSLIKIGTQGFALGLNISENLFGGASASYNIDMSSSSDVTGVISNNTFNGYSAAAIRATNARGLVVLNNTLLGSVQTVIELGSAARSIWVQDKDSAAYYSGSAAAKPNLRLDGRMQFGGTGAAFPALKNNGAALETKLADDSGYAQHIALSFKQSSGPTWTSAAGAPAGACTTGSLYSRTDGGVNSTLYVCQAGAWTAK